jgi:TAT (twin-arginine translocation) pathway signal sequence
MVNSRRDFLKMGAAAAIGFPAIVPASVFGQAAPRNRINIGAIGVGRISCAHDLPGLSRPERSPYMMDVPRPPA